MSRLVRRVADALRSSLASTSVKSSSASSTSSPSSSWRDGPASKKETEQFAQAVHQTIASNPELTRRMTAMTSDPKFQAFMKRFAQDEDLKALVQNPTGFQPLRWMAVAKRMAQLSKEEPAMFAQFHQLMAMTRENPQLKQTLESLFKNRASAP